MVLVLDASVVACWILPDEQNARADLSLNAMETTSAFVPDIWDYQIRNLLLMNERRGRISPETAAAGLSFLSALPIGAERIGNMDLVLDLARKHRLTFYDAAYLELAMRKGAALATLDTALASAARAEGLETV